MENKVFNIKGLSIDHAAKEIILTKERFKESKIIGSNTYNAIVRATTDFPSYSIVTKTIKKKTNKVSYKGLNLKEMRRFLATKTQKEQQAFEKVIELVKDRKGAYAIVKKWFLDQYKEEYNAELEELKIKAELDKIAAELPEEDIDELEDTDELETLEKSA